MQSLKKAFYQIIKSIAGLILAFNVLSFLWVLLYGYIPIPVTKLMVIEGETKEVDYQWVDLENISGKVQLAVMCAEDQYFILHDGLDFKSIEEAIESNKRGGRVKGASTITQQVAKNVFLWPDRDWARKGAELYYALLIDAVWSKERIMEVYLNIAEMGDGVFGVEAASKKYFKKSASDLTTQQAALIAAILPSPKRYSATNPGPYVQGRVSWITRQMGYWGNKMTYEKAFVEEMVK